jgi:hypothetical protein
MSITNEILTKYVDAQRGMIEFEEVGNDSVLMSLPLHFSAFTRVELAITRISSNDFFLSDLAQTIGELKNAGHKIGGKVMERIEEIVKLRNVQLDGNTLVRYCKINELGTALYEFAEAAKTIGDAYLVYKVREDYSQVEETLKERVRETLKREDFAYEEEQSIQGELESHEVDFYIPPNGRPGLALAVLPNPNRLQCEAWGFKANDIKAHNKERVAVGLVYDATRAKDVSRHIIEGVADMSIPSTDFDRLSRQLIAIKSGA